MFAVVNKYVFRTIAVFVALLLICLIYKGCKKEPLPLAKLPLPADTEALLTLQADRILTQTNKGLSAQYIPDTATTTITIKKDGTVVTHVQQAGMTFRPVIGPVVSDRLRLAGGVQFAYFNRFEAYAGLAGPPIAAWIGAGFRLDQIKLNNTSIFISYMTDRKVGIGLLLRF